MRLLLPKLLLSLPLLFLCLCPRLTGQEATPSYRGEAVERRDFDEQRWRELTEGIDYSADRVRRRKQEEEAGSGTAPPDDRSGGAFGAGVGNLLMKLFVVIVGLVLLILLVRSLLNLRRRPRDKQFDPTELNIDIAQIEANIHESNLTDFIRQAEEKGNFALAVRLYYLAALKELSLGKVIRWKKDKTNRDYRREMNGHPLAGDFDFLTRAFETAWYGQQAVTEERYRKLAPAFRDFLAKADPSNRSRTGAATAAETP